MKITDRDKKLLCVVAAIIIIFCAWYFGYRLLTEKNTELEEGNKKLTTTLNNLKVMKANEKKYNEETPIFLKEYDEDIQKYDAGFSQEHTLMFLDEIQQRTGVWISQAGMSQTEQVYSFGNIKSTNPYVESRNAYQSDYVGYKTTITTSFQGTYQNYKDMISFLNNYKYRCTINSMSTTYNSETGVVTGSMTINQYAITGNDRDFSNVNIGVGIFGTDNIYDSEIFEGENSTENNGEGIIADYDYYVSLMSYKSENGTVSIGAKNDVVGASTISTDENSVQKVNIRFFGEEGKYYVQYSIGDKEFPATSYDEGSYFIPGQNLSLLVIGSERVDDKDNSGARVTIVNDTDMVLYVKVANDDASNPRFELESSSGEVVLYN